MGELETCSHFMNGQYVSSESDKRSKVSYPYNGKVWASVPLGTTEDIDRAVTAARNALESEEWSGFLPSERADLLYDIADAIDDHADEFAEMETRQNRKIIREMRSQMQGPGEWYRYYTAQSRTTEEKFIPVEKKK